MGVEKLLEGRKWGTVVGFFLLFGDIFLLMNAWSPLFGLFVSSLLS